MQSYNALADFLLPHINFNLMESNCSAIAKQLELQNVYNNFQNAKDPGYDFLIR